MRSVFIYQDLIRFTCRQIFSSLFKCPSYPEIGIRYEIAFGKLRKEPLVFGNCVGIISFIKKHIRFAPQQVIGLRVVGILGNEFIDHIYCFFRFAQLQ